MAEHRLLPVARISRAYSSLRDDDAVQPFDDGTLPNGGNAAAANLRMPAASLAEEDCTNSSSLRSCILWRTAQQEI